ncbi:uncharacterized protein [Zea mays]|uniref:Uncharacterized protein n=1 Tax=Zea mays TaxID=4577 RepID=A0A1D6F6N9_MAIZE|nr:uncharacterized protein LOC103648067 isoform X2 [Zea mays]ONM26927.1 hypothetical protein ZEAMMB73_Zm00001d007470 [Zea mays]|eukprot:XP_008670791.1 uncharacterized protein LOC103648067 isoform X2 [Zea mays]
MASSSKQNAAVAAISVALLLTSHLAVAVAVAAGAEAGGVAPLNTCETPIAWAPCFGKTWVCVPLCLGLHYTGGFCQQEQMSEGDAGAEPAIIGGAICVCTKQCLLDVEAVQGAPAPSQPPVAEPPRGMRGVGMLN